MRFRIEGLDHIALAVGDQSASLAWYRDVLGLEREFAETWGDSPLAMMAGGTGLALFDAATTTEPPGGMRHIAFRVDRANFELAQQELREAGIDFAFEDHQVSHSIYFHDPDGVVIELTTYEL